jgi:hypothetical protein
MPVTDIALGNTSALSGDWRLPFNFLWREHQPLARTCDYYTTSYELARLEGVEPSSLGLEAIILAIGRQTHIGTQGRIRTHELFRMVLETIAFDRSATCVFCLESPDGL